MLYTAAQEITASTNLENDFRLYDYLLGLLTIVLRLKKVGCGQGLSMNEISREAKS